MFFYSPVPMTPCVHPVGCEWGCFPKASESHFGGFSCAGRGNGVIFLFVNRGLRMKFMFVQLSTEAILTSNGDWLTLAGGRSFALGK
jgi:hypothetical protein